MISIVSDVHIKSQNDEPYKLFLSFLNNPIVEKSEKVILLGDIFDVFVGGNLSFVKEFDEIFSAIKKLLEKGIDVYYIEGNHDFHIGKLLKQTFLYENFYYSCEKVQILHEGKNIIFCHGDDIEIENPSYKRYSRIVRSAPVKFLAEKLLPFIITRAIGDWASAKSRKKNIEKYESKKDLIKDKFRRSAEKDFSENNSNIIVSGHSHVKDLYKSDMGFTYINNGFFPNEKTFICIEKGRPYFSELAAPSL